MMANVYRQIWMSFWTDAKVDDDFTPEDKYFYLYLLTNPHTNMCGCYEISMKQMSKETGYNEDTVKRLLERMKTIHGVIDYDLSTKEVLIVNWHKYNWNASPDFLNFVRNSEKTIKNEKFRISVSEAIDLFVDDKKSKDIQKKSENTPPWGEGGGTTVTVTNINNNNNSISFSKEIKLIIDYYNNKLNKRYTYSNKSYNSKISARLREGFTVDDFKTVIDKKYDEWIGTEYEQYLTPDTLFSPSKFEKYLNQTIVRRPKSENKGEQYMNETKDALRAFLGKENI